MFASNCRSVTLLEDVFYEAKLKIRALEFSDRGVYSLTASVGGESITEDFTVKVNSELHEVKFYSILKDSAW